VKSFAPVSLMAIVPSVLVVNPSLPVAKARRARSPMRKSHPGKLAYGSAEAAAPLT
jgi:tripartite-type tricarboxylate transporter receptor subunit TctC